jgi:protoporphyrinogen/coproporphyrinogen III oxidase
MIKNGLRLIYKVNGKEDVMKHIVIIGGGIAGLSAAYYASKQTMIRATSRSWSRLIIGAASSLQSASHDGEGQFVIEGGPDTFVVTKPWGVRLCKELGIADRLRGTNPETKKTYILKNEKLHELPGGLTMMIPTEFGPMIRTGLLSWPAKARMGSGFHPARGSGEWRRNPGRICHPPLGTSCL